MESKVRVVIGGYELECSGTESFVHKQVEAFMEHVLARPDLPSGQLNTQAAHVSGSSSSKLELTANSMAAKLGPKSGPELIMVAAAHLTLVRGLETFSRSELIATMKQATGFYKESYLSNLSNYLQNLLKDDKLREQAKDRYAIEARTLEAMKARMQ